MPNSYADRMLNAHYLMSTGLGFLYGTFFFSFLWLFGIPLIPIGFFGPLSVVLIFFGTFRFNKKYFLTNEKFIESLKVFENSKKWLKLSWMLVYLVMYFSSVVLLIVSAALYGKYVNPQ